MWLDMGLVVALLGGGWALISYAGLNRSRKQAANAWARLDVQLRRRHDLVQRMLKEARGPGELADVALARERARQANSMGMRADAEAWLERLLRGLLRDSGGKIRVELSKEGKRLCAALEAMEEKIRYAGQVYNDSVSLHNANEEAFPLRAVCRMMGRSVMERFELTECPDHPAHRY